MREIKFKFYDKKTKKLLEECDMWWNYIEFLNEENVIVCQFTGLTDEDGEEIYEGDIVMWEEQNILKEFQAKKHYALVGIGDAETDECGNYFGVWFQEINNPLNKDKNNYYENDIAKIIGNLYENPELLNESN